MSNYVLFKREQIEAANAADLTSYLQRRGEKLLPSGHDRRLASDHSVTIRGSKWYDHSSGEGGRAIDFVQRQYGLSFQDAVAELLNGPIHTPVPEPARRPFVLPTANGSMRRVFAYLVKQRGIDPSIVSFFAYARTLYEDAQYHNCVFVGTDENGVARHAHKRSTNSTGESFRQNIVGSDPRFSFHYAGTGDRLFVFEAPIDMLSYLTLYPSNWQKSNYVSLCGVGGQALFQMLDTHGYLREVCLCLDSDEAGQHASDRLEAVLAEKDCTCTRLIPERKDWNDDLVATREHSIKMEGFA